MKDIIASMTMFNEDPAMLQRAVDSFLNTELDVEIILSDNSPTDAFRNRFTDAKGRITYIYNNRNLGFAAGQNVGIRAAMERGCKYHLILNPDIYFEKGALEGLFEYMETHPEAGLILPKVLYPDGSIQYLYRLLPTPFDLFMRRFIPYPFTKIFQKRIERYELKLKEMDLEKTQEIPYLSGCFMFIRGTTFKETGIFDERFFLYLDDVDLSRRLYRHGKNIYYPGVTVYHEHMQTSYKNFKFLNYHIKSAIRYFNKYGWFFDSERRTINRSKLRSLRSLRSGE